MGGTHLHPITSQMSKIGLGEANRSIQSQQWASSAEILRIVFYGDGRLVDFPEIQVSWVRKVIPPGRAMPQGT